MSNTSAFAACDVDLSLTDPFSFYAGLARGVTEPHRHAGGDWLRREQSRHDTGLSSLHPNVGLGDRRVIPKSLSISPSPWEELAADDLTSGLWEELVADEPSNCSEDGCDSSCRSDEAQLFELMKSLENEISLQPAEQHSATSSPSQRSFLDCSSWIPSDEDEWTDESVSNTCGFPLLQLEADQQATVVFQSSMFFLPISPEYRSKHVRNLCPNAR